MQTSSEYRVFVSYSHEDEDKAAIVLKHLRDIGVTPMSDQVILGGTRFSDSIRWQITCAHVFLSILTEESQRSTWVVSELGYAMGVGTAVLPLSLGRMPEGLAHELHAIKVKQDLSDLPKKLTIETIENLVYEAREGNRVSSESEDKLLGRTKKLIHEARSLIHFPRAGFLRVRQRMAFSSFSIPNEPPNSPIWDLRDGPNPRTEEERNLLRKERQIMEKHAQKSGCDLILDPYVKITNDIGQETTRFKHSRSMTLVRLRILRDFLKNFSGSDLRIVFNKGNITGSTIILGDWLSAEAVVPHYKSGYRQTAFLFHAPTLISRIEDFEQELQDCLRIAGVSPENSRERALFEIEQLIEKIEQTES